MVKIAQVVDGKLIVKQDEGKWVTVRGKKFKIASVRGKSWKAKTVRAKENITMSVSDAEERVARVRWPEATDERIAELLIENPNELYREALRQRKQGFAHLSDTDDWAAVLTLLEVMDE